MAPRVIVVEDEEALSLVLRYNLESEGYAVETIARGDEAEIRLQEVVPELLILDWMVPGISGIELCRRLRARLSTATLPIIMLTARGDESERVRGLLLGADDYIVKPFSMKELLARVRALVRRSNPSQLAEIILIGDIELNRTTYRAKRGGRDLRLGPTEFRLLEFMMLNPGKVFSRSALLDGVWGQSVFIDERTVDVHVGRLRKALACHRLADPFRTVRGAGYSFDEEFAEKAKAGRGTAVGVRSAAQD